MARGGLDQLIQGGRDGGIPPGHDVLVPLVSRDPGRLARANGTA